MGWPLSQDYNEAVQTPRASFADPVLQAGEVAVGPMGLPLPRSGNFADVYQVRTPDGRTWAVKCFTRPVAGLQERYARIDEHLHEARLPFTVGFRFLTEGIRVRGQWYPVVQMEWVEGFTLNEFVRQQAGRPDMLRALLGMWVRLCKRLRDARIAHADLQHGNVLLVPGETANKLRLRLIDYDGMWVPALAGKPSGEAGHPAYQHPARLKDRVYSADVDRFPHLVIGCALRAVAVAGKALLDRFDNGDNLLFRETDLGEPGKSKLFRALWDLDDPTVTNLVALLVTSARRPLRDTPWLDEVVAGDRALPVADKVLAQAATVLGVPRRAARPAAPAAQIYSIPEEANAFADLLDDRPRPKRRRRPRKLPLIPIIAGGGVVAAALVVLGLLALRDGKDPTPTNPGAVHTTTTTTVDPGPVPAAPVAVDKRGTLQTEWAAVESGPPMAGAAALGDGIDPAKTARFLRTYLVRGAGGLGAWFLPDGDRALLAGRTGLGLLDLRAAPVKVEPLAADLDLVAAVFTPDGRYAVTADTERIVRGFDLETGQTLFTRGFPSAEVVLAVTPDGRRVGISAPGVGYAEWALPKGAEVRRHESLQAVRLAYSPDGKRAVIADKGGAVELWDLVAGKGVVVGVDVKATAVAVTADGSRALAATEAAGHELRAWAFADGGPRPARPLPVKSPVTVLAVTPEGTPVVGTQAGEVAFVPEGESSHVAFVAGPADQPAAISSLALTGDGRHLLAATDRAAAYLFRTDSAAKGPVTPKVTPKKTPPSPGPPWLQFVRAVGIPPDATLFAVDATGDRFLAASPNRLIVYDAGTFQQKDSFRLADAQITAAGFGPGETVVLTERAADGTVRTRAWDLKAQTAGPAFSIPGIAKGATGQVTRIVPVPDRAWVLGTTTTVGDVLFDPKTGKVVEGWPTARPGDNVAAAPTPDGKAIALGSAVRPVQLWDTTTMTFGPPFEASPGFGRLAFTPDGKGMIGLGAHGCIRVWDAGTGKVEREVDHDHSGPFADLVPLGDDVIALREGPEWRVMQTRMGKVAGPGGRPDPLAGRGPAIGRRGWVLAAARDDRLTAWKVLPERMAEAPPARPGPRPFPDVKLVRDAPRAPAVGLAFVAAGTGLVSATETHLTRYSTDRLRFEKEVAAEEGPLRGMAVVKDKLFTLGKKSVVVRSPDTLEKIAEYPVSIGVTSNPVVFVVHPDGNSVLVSSDRMRELNLGTKKESVVQYPRSAFGKSLSQFAWAADGRAGVARFGNEIAAVWSPRLSADAKVFENLKAPAVASAQGLAVGDYGRLAVLGTRAGELKVWDATNGKALFTEAGVYKSAGGSNVGIEAVLFRSDGSHFVTTAADGRTTLWRVDGFTRAKETKGPPGAGRAAVSPDGRRLVVRQPDAMQLIELPDFP